MDYEKKPDLQNIGDILMLSPMQEGILYHYLKDQESEQYFEQLSLRLTGNIQPGYLERAWNFVVENNEMLRTVFRWKKIERPVQLVLKEQQLKLTEVDLTILPVEERQAQLKQIKLADRGQKFDLETGPLLRVMLVKLTDESDFDSRLGCTDLVGANAGVSYEMIISYHHILFDGWSTGIILKEVTAAYAALLNGQAPLRARKSKFKEYLKWLKGSQRQADRIYWQDYLRGFDTKTLLPLDFSGQSEETVASTSLIDTYTLKVGKNLADDVQELARTLAVTVRDVVVTAWGIFLQRFNNSDDIIFGETVSGRAEVVPGIEEMVGLLINTVPVRVQKNPGQTVAELLSAVNRDGMNRKPYEATPLVDIKAGSELAADDSLFDFLIAIENYPLDQALQGTDAPFTVKSYEAFEATNYDLTVVLTLWEGLEFKFIYRPDLFTRGTLERTGRILEKILREMANHPELAVSQLDILPAEERELVLDEFNNTLALYPKNRTVCQTFLEQVVKTPLATALVYGDAELTYSEVNARAARLARQLRGLGVGPESIVAMLVEPSFEMIVGILAILKAGGAYLPMDPKNPVERIQYMLEDSGTRVLLTQTRFTELVPATGQTLTVLALDEPLASDGEMLPDRSSASDGEMLPDRPSASDGEMLPDKPWASDTETMSDSPVDLRDTVTSEVAVSLEQELLDAEELADSLEWLEAHKMMDTRKPVYQTLFEKYMHGKQHGTVWKNPARLKGLTELSAKKAPMEFGPDQLNIALPDNLAYVIYTSGSTGKPKGVLVQHGSLLSLLTHMQRSYPVGPDDTWLLKTTYTFDVSLTEIFGWLVGSGRLAILPAGDEKDPQRIIQAVERYRVTHLNFVPSMYNVFVDYLEITSAKAIGTLKYLMVAGEAISKEQVRRFYRLMDSLPAGERPATKFINLYGPTEATVYATEFSLEHAEHYRSVPIGRGVANTRLYVLDKDNNVQPVGFMGELCIDGVGVARGYLKRPELTAEKFVIGPKGKIMYRTGDLARWLPDGNIEYLGRLDFQVKIRGYRIEIGEVENQLLTHPVVKEAVVVARERTGQKYLAAYVVAERQLTATELQEHLRLSMPEYMVPEHVILLQKLPLLENGKVNRRALPEPEGLASERAYRAPRNECEERLVAIWQETLGVERVGIEDNFFELGGHSLKAVQVTAKIYKAFNVEISVRDLFELLTVERLAGRITGLTGAEQREIPVLAEAPHYPVSSAQKRLYLLYQLKPESIAYNMPVVMDIEGQLDVARFEQTLRTLIGRHAALRTSFKFIGEELVQVIAPEVDFKVTLGELPLAQTEKHNELQAAANALGEGDLLTGKITQFVRPFRLAEGPLFRCELVRWADERYLLLMDMHHIISDGASWEVFVEEFIQAYSGEELPALRLQYRDFAVWQNAWLKSDEMKAQEQYWLQEFAGELPVLNLPLKGERPLVQNFAAQSFEAMLDREVLDKLEAIAQEAGATLFMTLLALYNVLLQKYSGQEDIVVGTPVLGRSHPDLAKIIGMFVNTLALRTQPVGQKTFTQYLAEVREKVLQAFENQDYQFELLIEELDLPRNLSRNPLFDTIFALQANTERTVMVPGVKFSTQQFENPVTKFDLSVLAEERLEGLALRFEYCRDLFSAATVQQMAGHFCRIALAVAENPEVELKAIDMLTAEEKDRLLFLFNDTRSEYPEATVHELFEAQVLRTPENEAIAYVGEVLTYRELNARANQLAHALKAQGVGPDSVVGLVTERSLEMIIGILGILKADGAYLPFDPDLPEERKQFMLQDAGVQVVVTQGAGSEQFAGVDSVEVLALDGGVLANWPVDNLPHQTNPRNLAYVMFTSGSTGTPKGVMIEHRGIVRMFFNTNHISIGENERALQVATYTFDASTFEIWSMLLFGGRLTLVKKEQVLAVKELAELLVKEQITVGLITTALFNQLAEEAPASFAGFKTLLVGGEAMSASHVRRVLPYLTNTELFNAYGPTENTTYTTCHRVRELAPEVRTVPIGIPVSNTRVYILDKHLQLVPEGAQGEIYIAGDGLARGYINRADLNQERFIENPWIPGEIIYKSGDLGRYWPDGAIEFCGRVDRQVKIRGFRIEIDEIEAVLRKVPGVSNAVVLVKKDNGGNNYLVAYLVADTGLFLEELRNDLTKTLPVYMIPGVFVKLEQLPLTANGKVDWRALPEPEGHIFTGVEFEAPRTAVEWKVAKVFAETLGIERVGVHDSFFSLGGHSLKAAQVIKRIERDLHVELPLRELFTTPVVQDLARVIEALPHQVYPAIEAQPRVAYYPLSSAQQRLFLLTQFEPDSVGYNIPMCLEVRGELDLARFSETFQALIERHESLRTRFKMVDGVARQEILVDVHFTDVFKQVMCTSELTQAEIERAAREFVQPFDLKQAPLFRVELHSYAEGRHLLLIDIHHIISDGLSMNLLIREFALLYAGEELPPLSLQYRDYTLWQQKFFKDEDFRRQEEYWVKEFAGEVPVLNLLPDFARPPVQSFEGASHDCALDAPVTAALKKLVEADGATMYMALLAAYNVLLMRYTAQTELVVGTPVHGRWHADLEAMVGMFVNTLAIKTAVTGQATFREILRAVKEKALGALENQDYPFEKLVDSLNLERDLSRNPLFDTIFALQNMVDTSKEIAVGGLTLHFCKFQSPVAKVDLTLTAIEEADSYAFRFEYARKLYRAETIERMAGHFLRILEEVAANPDQPVCDIQMLPPEEIQRLLHVLNDTDGDFPRDKTLHQRFEEQVARTPERVALRYERQQLTYRELSARTNQLARALREKGVVPDMLVGMHFERSLEMVIAILGILTAGGGYLPIDPAIPVMRKQFMLEDASVTVLLTMSNMDNSFAADRAVEVINLDETEQFAELPVENLPPAAEPHNLAYVIYTSGSTGMPKGVLIEHRTVARLVFGNNYAPFEEGLRILQAANYAFDASVIDFWGSLWFGGSLVLIPKEKLYISKELVKVVQEEQIDFAIISPVVFHKMIDELPDGLSTIKYLMMGGDVVSVPHVEKALQHMPNTWIENGYGPTETTVIVAYHVAKTLQDLEICSSFPIGKAVTDSKLYILDSNMQLMPEGAAGEIYIGGRCLARGYLNREELTREKFVPNPFIPGEKMYRSGDLGRFLPDGSVEFLGRIDSQVKIRGLRIELGEIEAALCKYPGIKSTIVLVKEDATKNKYIAAYYESDIRPQVVELRSFLAQTLPEYMIPTRFVGLSEFPLTATGKIDRKALPEPQGSVTEGEYLAPRTQLERQMAAIFGEILGLTKVGVRDSFFTIGGHSMKASQLAARIFTELNVEVTLSEVFQHQTVAELAQLIAEKRRAPYREIIAQPVSEYYPLAAAQRRMFILMQLDKTSLAYNMPIVMQIKGKLEQERFMQSFATLVQRHESLRTGFMFIDGEPAQKVFDNVEFAVHFTTLEMANLDARIHEFMQPFDLTQPPLLRVELAECLDVEDCHMMFLDMHHIISDGFSIEVLIKEFGRIYAGEEMLPLRIQYRDFAIWQNTLFQGGAAAELEEYWLNQFAGEIPLLNLPLDFPRPAVQNFAGNNYGIKISRELSEEVKVLAEKQGLTLYMTLLALYYVVLHRYSGQEDIIVGTPVLGRTHPDLFNIIGMFVNTVALRNRPQGEKTLAEFFGEVKEHFLKAFDHQDYQFETLIERLGLMRDMSRNPLFDVVFALQNVGEISQRIAVPGLTFSEYRFDNGTSKFDLLLSVAVDEDGLDLIFSYASALFKPETVERMARHYVNLVQAAVANPYRPIADLEMLTSAEKEMVIYSFNKTQRTFPAERTLQSFFEERARKTPARIMMEISGESLRYGELNARANRLARLLRAKGVGRNTVVGLLVDKSKEMFIGILAILKSGGAYLPLNLAAAPKQLEWMLEDSGAQLLLTCERLQDLVSPGVEVIYLDDANTGGAQVGANIDGATAGAEVAWSATAGLSTGVLAENESVGDDDLPGINEGTDLACIFYPPAKTELSIPAEEADSKASGFEQAQTMEQKAVGFDHRAVISQVCGLYELVYVHFRGSINLAVETPYYLSGSLGQLFVGPFFGHTLYLVSDEILADGQALLEFYRENIIGVADVTPPQLSLLAEALQGKAFIPVKHFVVRGEGFTREVLQELLLKLAGVKPQFTYLYGVPGCPDALAYSPDVEQLNELTTLPLGKPLMNKAAYILDRYTAPVPLGVPGEIYLAGEGLAQGDFGAEAGTAEQFIPDPFVPGRKMYRTGDLGKLLPDGTIVLVGKALRDRKLERRVAGKMTDSAGVKSDFVAPRNELETRLAQIWQKVLGVQRVGINENFFELGGSSLQLIKVYEEVSGLFPEKGLKIADMFTYNTLAQLADALSEAAPQAEVTETEPEIDEFLL